MNPKTILLFLICYFAFLGQVLASEKVLIVGICGPKPYTFTNSILSCKSSAEKIIAGTVFNSLLKYSPGSPSSVEQELAENIPNPRVSGGKQYWTFAIRKGVMFHKFSGYNDYELDADDVAYSLKLLAGSDNCKFLSEIQIRKESQNKITLILDRPLSPSLFLPKLTGYNGFYIFSRKILEEEGLFSGTGPFMFVSGTEDDCLDLRANRSYFLGEPNIDCVRFVFGSDILKMEQDILRGDLDVLVPPKEFLKSISIDDKNLERFYFYSGHFIYLGFNLETEPFNDMRFRKVIAKNINRDALCSKTNRCERLYGLAPKWTSGSMTRDEIVKLGLDYSYQEGSAKKLLVQAVKPINNAIEFCTNNITVPDEIINVIRYSLMGMGINTTIGDSVGNIKICPDNTSGLKLLSINAAENIQTLLDVLMADGVIDKKYKFLFDASRKETSNNKQGEILKHVQMKILNDMNILPLLFLREYILTKKKIHLGYDCSWQPFFIVTEKTRIED